VTAQSRRCRRRFRKRGTTSSHSGAGHALRSDPRLAAKIEESLHDLLTAQTSSPRFADRRQRPTAFLRKGACTPGSLQRVLISCATRGQAAHAARRSLAGDGALFLERSTMLFDCRARSPNSSLPPTAMLVSRSPAASRLPPAWRSATGRATLRQDRRHSPAEAAPAQEEHAPAQGPIAGCLGNDCRSPMASSKRLAKRSFRC